MELRRGNLADQIVEVIRARIDQGDYPIGSKLPTEHELLCEFGVSRAVVREAIANLRANGLVTTRQGVGVFVQQPVPPTGFVIPPIELDDLPEKIAVLDLRIGVEVEGAGLAATRRTPEALAAIKRAVDAMDKAIADGSDAIDADISFHRAVAMATNNVHFDNLFAYLGTLSVPRRRIKTYGLSPEAKATYLNRINDEHRAVSDAIHNSDADNARSAMRLHLMNSKQRLLRELEAGGAK